MPGLDAHTGVWMALQEFGINADCCYGCSAGAIISALDAAGRDPRDMYNLVRSLKTSDVIRKRFAWKSRIFWLDWFCNPAPIVELLETLLPETFAELKKPLTVSATRMDSMYESAFRFSSWNLPDDMVPLRDAVLASMSIFGVFPAVPVGRHMYSDGGTTQAIPLPADFHDYDRLVVINLERRAPYIHRDRNIISRLLWNVEQLSRKEPRDAHAYIIRRFGLKKLIWLDIDMGSTSMLDFDHDLQIRAYYQAIRQLRAHFAGIGHVNAASAASTPDGVRDIPSPAPPPPPGADDAESKTQKG